MREIDSDNVQVVLNYLWTDLWCSLLTNEFPKQLILCSLSLSSRAASWKDRWVQSKQKSDYGSFDWTAGKFYGDAEKDKGKM